MRMLISRTSSILEVPQFFGGWRGIPEPSAVHALTTRKKNHLSWMIFAIMRSANTNKRGDGMYDTTIAAKLLSQLESFLGRISPHFHKPTVRFIGDMIYGIMVEKDIKLSSIVRALKDKATPKKVEDRLSRMLSAKGLEGMRLFKYDKIKAMAYPPNEVSIAKQCR